MVAVKTVKIGPKSHGRPIGEWEFDAAEFVPGYKYELIDGRIEVSAEPEPQENALEEWLTERLRRYAEGHPEVIDRVVRKSRVYVPIRRRTTIPEPDIACYSNFPHARMLTDLSWHEVSPVLVVEVLVFGDPAKDLTRNVALYLRVPSVKEYWVLDGRLSAAKPSLIRHRRVGTKWVVKTYAAQSEFTSKLLPGFKLVLDPLA